MRLIDISVAVRPGTPEWPGDTPYSCGWTGRIVEGSSVNLSHITMSPHVGTHADAPLHVSDGLPASEALPLAAFVGPAWVWTVDADRDEVTMAELAGLPAEEPIERLLLRTGRTIADGAFPERWPVLAVPAVHELLARGLVLLGVDAPSVDARDSRSLEVHHALFAGGAYNIENLDLRHVADGPYELLALPLHLLGLDAAPLRAALHPRG
ncbi:MAG TPA: cyclase family protein [Gemmatimonadaceae bacterium]|nr:cyclase family protein [Gemmatimonadaceae bacterium]